MARLVELGIPYSDPLADGPVIQAAASRALEVGTTPVGIGDVGWAQGRAHHAGGAVHLQQPAAECGHEVRADAAAGAAGLVVPTCRLRKPRSSPHGSARAGSGAAGGAHHPAERMGRIAAASRGFTYMVSVTGVTGERAQMESRVAGLWASSRHGAHARGCGLCISGPQQAIEVRIGAPMARLWAVPWSSAWPRPKPMAAIRWPQQEPSARNCAALDS